MTGCAVATIPAEVVSAVFASARAALPVTLFVIFGNGQRTQGNRDISFIIGITVSIGRDAALLQRLSMESGLHLITNTGYYAAADHKYVPKHAYEQNADQIAHRWIEESSEGIEQTGIKPGIIKIGVNKAPLPAIDRKLVEAAALTHKTTGLKIASHTGDGAAALEQMEILRQNGVPPSAFIWVHAHNETNSELHLRAAELGAWVEFDGISEKSEVRDLGLIRKMVERDCLRNTLISMDAGWYHVGEPDGGSFRTYETIFTRFVPALKKSGITEQQICTLLVENPRRCLTPAKTNDRHFKDGKRANNEHA